jgi:hypothetical protein
LRKVRPRQPVDHGGDDEEAVLPVIRGERSSWHVVLPSPGLTMDEPEVAGLRERMYLS